MPPDVRKWFDLPRLLHTYKRRMPVVLSMDWPSNRKAGSRTEITFRDISTSRFRRSWSTTEIPASSRSIRAAR